MEGLGLFDYLVVLKRHLKLFAAVFVVLLAVSFVYAQRWSNYRATATIEVEDAEVAAGTTTPVGTIAKDAQLARADERISHVQQHVLSTGVLAEIIGKFDLYSSARAYTPVADIAAQMVKKIKIALVDNTLPTTKAPGQGQSIIAFTLSFDYNNPLLAQQVTNELATRFVDDDLRQQRHQAEETGALLATHIDALEKSMSEQEKKIEVFRTAHGDVRPDALVFNQQFAASLSTNIQSIDTQIATNEGLQGSLRAQLAIVDPYARITADGQPVTTPALQLKALHSQLASLQAQYGEGHPDVVKTKRQIEALKSQTGVDTGPDTADLRSKIADLRTNLAATRKSYGSDNPDVQSLERQLASLEKVLAETKTSHTGPVRNDADNPAYLQLTAQLDSAVAQHKALMEQKSSLLAQQAKYSTAVAANPTAERELAALTRDYDNSHLRYRELKEKKMAADMTARMQAEGKDQHLVVINPPELPTHTQPSRAMLIIGGFVLSLFGASASVILRQLTSRGIINANHLTQIVGLSPLVSVPHITTMAERIQTKRKKMRFVILASALAVIVVLMFFFFVLPFDVFVNMAAQRLGLI